MQSLLSQSLAASITRWTAPQLTTPILFATSSLRRQTILRRYTAVTTHPEIVFKNVSRIYARRTLEIAAASAAVQRFCVELENRPKPTNWENWERREFSQQHRDSLGHSKLARLWAATKRIGTLSCLMVPYIALYPFTLVSERLSDLSWRYSLFAIEQAGPTFIKLFQWATTRQDLFSPEFCQFFGRLQDQTAGHSWKHTQKILQEELGDLKDIVDIETDPIGSGCVAQVYRGTITQPVGKHPVGTEIAVKVQHPGIWDKVSVDFYIMQKVANFLESLPYLNLKYLSFSDSVRQFRDIMLPQLNLNLEAEHLQRFNRDFSNDDRVSFPHPLTELTTTRVLVETFVHGTPILHFVNASDAERKELALLGLDATLNMIFLHDFLHGDLHPGNILISRDESSGHFRMHLLDCGLVVEMGPEDHINCVKILGAFTRRDGRLAGQLMVDTSSDSQASPLDVELFVKGIENIVVDDENNNFLEKVGDYITDICFLACKSAADFAVSIDYCLTRLLCRSTQGQARTYLYQRGTGG